MSTATKLTPEQVQKLEQAIERARFPAGCFYLGTDDQPACVIGQLAVLEGVPTHALAAWDNQPLPGISKIFADIDEFAEYPPVLLDKLQSTWDSTDRDSEAHGRDRMRDILADYR